MLRGRQPKHSVPKAGDVLRALPPHSLASHAQFMKTKILVVDDEADLELLIKQKFRRKIRESTYEFVFANNGQEALDRIGEHPDTDVILSDINMPVMDGLTLLTHTHERHPAMKTVIVSAYGDLGNLRIAMNRGAFDFVVKPVDFTDLEVTIEKTAGQVRQLREQRVASERVLTEAQRQLGEHGELLADGERASIEAAMAKVREVAQGNDHSALKEAIHALDDVCKPFVERVMNQALTKVVAGHSVEEF